MLNKSFWEGGERITEVSKIMKVEVSKKTFENVIWERAKGTGKCD